MDLLCEWLTGGRDYQQTYFSPLSAINRDNIDELGYAWSYDIDFTVAFSATPIVVDGVMFSTGNGGVVYALDARTGARRWVFTPPIEHEVRSMSGLTTRGIAVWRGRVYVGSIDGFLYALDASTSEVQWRVDTIIDRTRGYAVSGAPYIAGDLVVIGNAGAEFSARGYITAYHAQNGEMAWRFFTVPASADGPFEHPFCHAYWRLTPAPVGSFGTIKQRPETIGTTPRHRSSFSQIWRLGAALAKS